MRMSSGAPRPEGESERFVVELPRGDPEIEQDEVRPESHDGRERLVRRVWARPGTRGRLPRAVHAPGRSPGIPIDAEDRGAGAEQRGRVAAVAQRAVDSPARARRLLAARRRGGPEHGIRSPGVLRRSLKENTPSARANGVSVLPGAGLTGLEPATSAVTVRHSNQAELQPPVQHTIITEGRSRWKPYLQYALIIEATRGSYCAMKPRFFAASAGLADWPERKRLLGFGQEALLPCARQFAGLVEFRFLVDRRHLEESGEPEQVVGGRRHAAVRRRGADGLAQHIGRAAEGSGRSAAAAAARRWSGSRRRSPWPARRRERWRSP